MILIGPLGQSPLPILRADDGGCAERGGRAADQQRTASKRRHELLPEPTSCWARAYFSALRMGKPDWRAEIARGAPLIAAAGHGSIFCQGRSTGYLVRHGHHAYHRCRPLPAARVRGAGGRRRSARCRAAHRGDVRLRAGMEGAEGRSRRGQEPLRQRRGVRHRHAGRPQGGAVPERRQHGERRHELAARARSLRHHRHRGERHCRRRRSEHCRSAMSWWPGAGASISRPCSRARSTASSSRRPG